MITRLAEYFFAICFIVLVFKAWSYGPVPGGAATAFLVWFWYSSQWGAIRRWEDRRANRY